MPDIFISYSSQDRPRAKLIAATLEAEGFDVWWDGVLRAGEPYDEVIEENLRGARAVVVLWSKTSSKSKWVRAEATVGERHSAIVPAIIEDCERPLRFELIQTADLIEWQGDRSDPNWQGLVADINTALDRETVSPSDDISVVPESDVIPRTVRPEIDQTSAKLVSDEVRPGVPRPLIAMAIFASATIMGIVLLVLANSIHIGGFKWEPVAGAEQLNTGAKEVGFYAALNWSLTTLLLMPVAWTLIYLALVETRAAWTNMVRQRMLVTKDFVPITVDHLGFQSLQKHIRLFVIGGIVTVTTLIVVFSMSDHAQVAGQFYGDGGEIAKLDRIDAEGYALETPNIERDWMVASFLSSSQTDSVDANLNSAFALATYVIYVGFGIGSLLSFGLVVVGVGATFMQGIAQNYGLHIIPSLNSDDPCCGFEVMRKFFVYAYAVAFIGCIMCYLMGIQNIYLRSPDESIFAFLSVDMTAFQNASNWREAIDGLFGFLFAGSVATGTRNAYVWMFGFFAFAVFIGGFMFFLRQGAGLGKAVVLEEIRTAGFSRLTALSIADESTVLTRLAKMRVWPLAQPSLRMSFFIVALFVASFVFYKLGVIIILGMCIALMRALLRAI